MRTDWDQRAFCRGCGARNWRYGSMADLANKLDAVCNCCGMTGFFEICVARWVSEATLWNPWTWLNGHWEKKEKKG